MYLRYLRAAARSVGLDPGAVDLADLFDVLAVTDCARKDYAGFLGRESQVVLEGVSIPDWLGE